MILDVGKLGGIRRITCLEPLFFLAPPREVNQHGLDEDLQVEDHGHLRNIIEIVF
jgi:hypothetical protein